ncbi:MAG: cytidine deaminase [Gemmatimonadota bacterium]|jgi:cytidine deaminase
MTLDRDALVDGARRVLDRAYAPYSGFRVGAAVQAEDGAMYVGCNLESASLGLTLCAERAAVAAAVAGGATTVEAVAIVSEGDEPVAPCGACRQVLAEFGMDMVVVSEAGGRREEWSLRRLLPAPFLAFRSTPNARSG